MARYLIYRGAGILVALFGVSVLAFLTTALVPGNPAEVLLGTEATPARLAAVTHQLGLDQPLWIRYLLWLKALAHGDLGVSTLSQQSVSSQLGAALPVTIELSLMALVLAVAFALPVGLWLGASSGRRWVRPIMFAITLGISVPGFWVGLLLITLFSVKLGLLPAGGYVAFTDDPIGNLRDMVLPSVTLALYLAPPLVRFTRATVASVLREEFVRTARAKGLRRDRILARHVAPNALLPTITYLGLQIGVLISGAIVTEVIFALPGIGSVGLNAILNRDYPLVQGVVLIVALGYVVTNMLVDLAYTLLDPRIRLA